MVVKRFDLFLDQQKRFKEALSNYSPGVWFPPLRGHFEEDNPGNWFIAFVPPSWGRWKEAIYGVHFDFMYARPRRSMPERIRLAVGVETPLRVSQRQAFKMDVISRIRAEGIVPHDFSLQAQARKKLIDTDPDTFIRFDGQSWQVALQHYIALQPSVRVIARVAREYYDSGAFACEWICPPEG